MATYSINTHDAPPTPPADAAPNRRTLIVSTIGFLIVAAIAWAAYEYWPRRLPSTDASAVELVKFCTTDQFSDLPLDKQEKYVEALMKQGFAAIAIAAQQAGLTQAERQKGMENAMQAGMQVRWGRHLDAWLKLDQKGKAAYVKEVVAQMPKRPPGMDPRANRNGSRFMTPDKQKRFIENMAPDRRAAMAEFMSEVRTAHGDGGR